MKTVCIGECNRNLHPMKILQDCGENRQYKYKHMNIKLNIAISALEETKKG